MQGQLNHSEFLQNYFSVLECPYTSQVCIRYLFVMEVNVCDTAYQKRFLSRSV